MDKQSFLLAEYQQYSEVFWRNEEAGERRVTFFITLTTAVIAAIVALRTSQPPIPEPERLLVSSAALAGTAGIGLITYLRMLHRDRVTDEYKAILRYLREQLKRTVELEGYVLPFRSHRHWLLRGGLAVTVAVLNSVLLAVLTGLWTEGPCRWLAVFVVILSSGAAQAWGIMCRNSGEDPKSGEDQKSEEKPKNEEELSQTFRAGVGAVIMNDKGEVLALERRDIAGAWQMPQGGMRIDEEPLRAAMREIWEETGIKESDLKKMLEVDGPLAYELPEKARSKKTGRGQAQFWYVFRYLGADDGITLGDKKEFTRWKWMPMDKLISTVASFKRPIYEELARYLARVAKDSENA